MTKELAIAEERHLWSEVLSLRTQLQDVHADYRRLLADHQALEKVTNSFVTQTQLDAALLTKISNGTAKELLGRHRKIVANEMLGKANTSALEEVQATKVDISVFESKMWDMDRFRASIEQSVHDLFASFASKMEARLQTKLSTDDFYEVFGPLSTSGTSTEVALDNIRHQVQEMQHSLAATENLIINDRHHQEKLAQLDIDLLELGRKQSSTTTKVHALDNLAESTAVKLRSSQDVIEKLCEEVEVYKQKLIETQKAEQRVREQAEKREKQLNQRVDNHEGQCNSLANGLNKLEVFTHETLAPKVNSNRHFEQQLEKALGNLKTSHEQQVQLLSTQSTETEERFSCQVDRIAQLENYIRRTHQQLEALTADYNAVKGPLWTEAINLREENTTILHEIERSQKESREIMLDYRDLLEKGNQLNECRHTMRPPSSTSAHTPRISLSALANRKHRKHSLWTPRDGDEIQSRPRTTNGTARELSTVVIDQTQLTVPRAKTAGCIPRAPARVSQSSAFGQRNSQTGHVDLNGPAESRRCTSFFHGREVEGSSDDHVQLEDFVYRSREN